MTDAQFHAILRQLTRIADALEKAADIEESAAESEYRARAIQLWSIGQGKHPDD